METAEQRERLIELGYPQAQGYLFARPQPPAAITNLLRMKQPTVAAPGG